MFMLLIPLLYGCATQTEMVYEESDGRQLVEKLNAYNDSIRAIEAHTLLMYSDGDNNYSFRAFIVAQNNGEYMRLDLSDFVFKKPVLSLVKSGDSVTALLHMKKRAYQMDYESLSLEALSGLNVHKEILFPALMGKVFVDVKDTVTSSPDAKTLVVESEGFREVVTFNSNWLPQNVEFAMRDDVYTLSFKTFDVVEEIYFPGKISLSNLNRRLEATYREVRINEAIDMELFVIDEESLSGYAVEQL
jgi:hypothetical protein